jgi:adenosine deaminase
VFCSPLSEEYRLAATHFNLTRQEVIDLNGRALDISFASVEEKGQLHEIFNSWAEDTISL